MIKNKSPYTFSTHTTTAGLSICGWLNPWMWNPWIQRADCALCSSFLFPVLFPVLFLCSSCRTYQPCSSLRAFALPDAPSWTTTLSFLPIGTSLNFQAVVYGSLVLENLPWPSQSGLQRAPVPLFPGSILCVTSWETISPLLREASLLLLLLAEKLGTAHVGPHTVHIPHLGEPLVPVRTVLGSYSQLCITCWIRFIPILLDFGSTCYVPFNWAHLHIFFICYLPATLWGGYFYPYFTHWGSVRTDEFLIHRYVKWQSLNLNPGPPGCKSCGFFFASLPWMWLDTSSHYSGWRLEALWLGSEKTPACILHSVYTKEESVWVVTPKLWSSDYIPLYQLPTVDMTSDFRYMAGGWGGWAGGTYNSKPSLWSEETL